MPRALFLNVPGHGHVNPSLPLVTELVRRGHMITYFITEQYRARVEAAGATVRLYTTVGDDYFEARGLSGRVPRKVAYELITTAGEILPELMAFAQAAQPDYILFDTMCPWGVLLARILRLPAVASLSLMPLPARALLSLQGLRTFAPVLFGDFGKGLEANQRSRALGRRYQITPLGPVSIMNALGDISFSYTSSYFQPFASALDKTIHFVGWTPAPDVPDPAFSFDRVRERRLIYVSLGTVNNADPGFFRACIDAFAGRDDFVMMTTGHGIRLESFGPLPDNIAIYSWVPQTAVLERAALIITHGGMNSVHGALYYGVPLLLAPQQPEQAFTSRRVVQLGAGLMLGKAPIDARALRESATRVLAEPRFRREAVRVGETLRTTGGLPRAVDEIERLLESRRVPQSPGDRRAAAAS